MEAQERIGTWCAWGVILLSWIAFFLVLALMCRATGGNRSSEAGTQSVDIVAESVGFEARAKRMRLDYPDRLGFQPNTSARPSWRNAFGINASGIPDVERKIKELNQL